MDLKLKGTRAHVVLLALIVQFAYAASTQAVQPPVLPGEFVATRGGYSAQSSQGRFFLFSNGFKIAPVASDSALEFRWSASQDGRLEGSGPNRGLVNVYQGRNPRDWQVAVRGFSQVRSVQLYTGIDATYYFRGPLLEFDLAVHPGADPRVARLALAGPSSGAKWRPQADGSLKTHIGGRDFLLRRPQAYQVEGEAHRAVECRYRLDESGWIGFAVDSYDARRELIIDPVLEYLTYLGGDREDPIQAIAMDSEGNVIVAGVTNSSNFPGAPAGPWEAERVFVTKLDPTGTRLIYTTFLGGTKGSAPRSGLDFAPAITVDSSGDVFVAGYTSSTDFPVTEGVWRTKGTGGFAVRLNRDGQVVYSTLLGQEGVWLSPNFARTRDGVLYAAGVNSQPEFLGTAGAYQRGNHGAQDFFVLALAPAGSGPVFLTGLGGTGNESLSGLLLTPEGYPMVVGNTSSPDFPLTSDAWAVEPAGPTQQKGLVALLDGSGGQLLYSTLLGAPELTAVAQTSEGDYVLAGRGLMEEEIRAAAPGYSFPGPSASNPRFVARFSGSTHRPQWVASMGSWLYALDCDVDGNVYILQEQNWVGGGSLALPGATSLVKLHSDGSRLLYSTLVPEGARFSVGTNGRTAVAGYTARTTLPTTPGVVQPAPDPAPAGQYSQQLNSNDGWIAVLDLGVFRDANFFLAPQRIQLSGRIGQPAADSVEIPIMLYGENGTLELSPSSEARLKAELVTDPAAMLRLSVPESQAAEGTFNESVAIRSSATGARYVLPVQVTVRRAVDFALAKTSMQLRYRQGQDVSGLIPINVPITTDFGSEYFSLDTESSDSRFYPSVYQSPLRLVVYYSTELPAGTYDTTITVSLRELPSVRHEFRLHVIVDPPAKLTLSTTSFRLQLTHGQAFSPDTTLKVTSDVEGAGWNLFVGSYMSWMQFRQSSTKTPGTVSISMDTSLAEPGVYPVTLWVSGEDKVSTPVYLTVAVGSGSALDVTPGSITMEVWRYPGSVSPHQQFAVVTPEPAALEVWSDENWVLPQRFSGTAPALLYIGFDINQPEGVRQGKLNVRANGITRVIQLTWKLYDLPHLVYRAEPMHFTYQIGGPEPAPQQFEITCPTLLSAAYYASPIPYDSYLKVSSSGFVTPGVVTVKIDVSNLKPGQYEGAVRIGGSYPDSTNYPAIPVTVDVQPDPNAPSATLKSLSNAASLLSGTVSPGEIVILEGSGIGQEPSVEAAPGADGRYPTQLAGLTVYFDDVAAPILAAGAGRLKVVAPFELEGRNSTSIRVEVDGQRSAALQVPVAVTNPGVFTADGSGAGPALAESEEEGAVVILHVTGLGVLKPAVSNGQVTGDPAPGVAREVTVLVGGRPAQLLSATAEPGQVAGAARLRLRLPDGLGAGPQAVLVLAADNPSQPGVTLQRR